MNEIRKPIFKRKAVVKQFKSTAEKVPKTFEGWCAFEGKEPSWYQGVHKIIMIYNSKKQANSSNWKHYKKVRIEVLE